MDHLDDDAVLAFEANDLAPAHRALIEAHLDGCARCRKLVSAFADASDVGRRDVTLETMPPESSEPRTLERDPPRNQKLVLDMRFECGELAGVGGMGRVYKGRDLLTGETVAVKIVQTSGLDHERFNREVGWLRGLDHPGIVRYIAHGATRSGQPYLVMEWLEGETLAARIAREPLSVEEALRVCLRVAEALMVVHAAGVVHRDLKPGNLLLVGREIDRVKLLDFGLAWQRGLTRRLTLTGVILGTPGFMAPEQVLSDGEVDPRTDLFALGCVLFQCFSGRVAFVGANVLSVLLKTVLEETPTLHVSGAIPEPVRDLLSRLLAKSPADRPATATAVASELRRLIEGESPPASLLLPASRAGSITGRERAVMTLVLARLDQMLDDEPTMSQTELVQCEAALGEAASEQGGRLDYLPDGSIAIAFSTPGGSRSSASMRAASASPTDVAARAARAALAVRTALAKVSEGSVTTLSWAVGAVSGRADRSAALSVGELVDRGVALLDRPVRNGVKIDEMTAGLLDERFDVSGDEGGLVLIGEAQAERTRTLLGATTECVGRDRELKLLEALFAECVEERVARAALVTGPAGIGKTRLRHELAKRIAARKIPHVFWVGRADPMRTGSAFSLAGDVLRHSLGVAVGEPLSVRQQRLRGRVGRNVQRGDAQRVTDFLGEVLGAPFSEETRSELAAARRNPQLMGDQIRRAWIDYLDAECSAQPVILALEDLHWGDAPSVDLVDCALRDLRDRPFFAIAFARPEVREILPKLWAERHLTEVRLAEITPKASARLARQVLGSSVGDDVIQRLVTQSDGNAFYLEELIRAAANGRATELPETVLAMVQARLAELDEDTRRLLRAASVFGLEFAKRGLVALLGGMSEAEVATRLAILCEHELIVARPDNRVVEDELFAFRQALVREAAYASLTDRDRKVGHRLAGQWLEKRPDAHAETLAEHFERGGEGARAAGYYLRAARQALDANDFEAAAARAEKAVASGAAGDDLGVARLLEAEIARTMGSRSVSFARASEAIALLRPGSQPYFEAIGELVLAAGPLGENDRLRWACDVLLTAAPLAEIYAAEAHVVALARTAMHLRLSGLPDDAARTLRRLEELRPSVTGDPWVDLALVQTYGVEAATSGDPAGYLASALEEARLRVLIGDLRGTVFARVKIGDARIHLGAYDEAEHDLRDVAALAERMRLLAYALQAHELLGIILLRRGQLHEALDVILKTQAESRAAGEFRHEVDCRIQLCVIKTRMGDLDGAERDLRVDDLPRHSMASPFAYAALADVRLARGDAAGALVAAEASMRAIEEMGGTTVAETRCRLAHARALHATGAVESAARAISDARARVIAQAARISDPNHKRAFLERVAENVAVLSLARSWLGQA